MNKAEILVLTLLLMVSSGLAQQSVTDSLENLLPATSGKERVNILCDLCWQYGAIDFDKAEKYGKEALDLAGKSDDSLLVAQAYNDLGTVYYRRGIYDTALLMFLNSLRIRQREGKKELAAASVSKIGITYLEQGRYELAAKYQLQALQFYQKTNDSVRMSQCLSNLGRVYYENHEYEKSIAYNLRALKIFQKYNYLYGIATTTGSLALDFKESGLVDTALVWFEKALGDFRKLDDKSNIATVLLDLGQIYRDNGEQEKGMAYYREAMNLSDKLGDKHTWAVAKANLANIYREKHDFSKAEKYYLDALRVAVTSDIKKVVHQCYRGLAELYTAKGDFQKAFAYKQKQYSIRDTLFNIDKYKQLSELETKYQTTQKEHQISMLKVQNENKTLRINRQRNLFLFVVVGGLLLFIIALLWYNRKILQQKAIRESEKNQYRKQLLEASIEAAEQERKRIAGELHDGIAQQLAALKIAWQNLTSELGPLDKRSGRKIENISQTLDQTADEVRNISHQMMPRALSEYGLIPAMEDMIDKSLKYSEIQYRFEHLVLIIEDNGRGFNIKDKESDGIGLMNIASRIDTVNGEINYEPSPGSGTVARVRIPVGEVNKF